jgi:hypothetical protein
LTVYTLPHSARHDIAAWRLDLLDFRFADLFFNQEDSVLKGYGIVGGELEGGEGRYRALDAPTCVLVDADGDGLSVPWCNCGYVGGGPSASQHLLRTLGFDERATSAIAAYDIVRLDRWSPEPVVASGSLFRPEWNGPQPTMRMIDDVPTLHLARDGWNDDAVFWRSWRRFAAGWTPAPVEVRIILGPHSVPMAPPGWHYSFRSEYADLLVSDASGRQFAAAASVHSFRDDPPAALVELLSEHELQEAVTRRDRARRGAEKVEEIVFRAGNAPAQRNRDAHFPI